MRRLWLPLALALALAPAAGAETEWDDSHMQSNFARQRGPAPPRPPVQGSSRYGQANEDTAEAPATGVAETTLSLSPHEWKQGGLSNARTSQVPWASSSSARSSLGSGRPTVSSGVRSHGSSRGGTSSLRSSSLGNQRRSRR